MLTFPKISKIPPLEYFLDMARKCMEKHQHYLDLSKQLPEHQHLLIQVSALFCFASRAFTDFLHVMGSSDAAYELDRIGKYIVKTELAEFVIACHFVICYMSEENMLKNWGGVDIRDNLYNKFHAVESLSREFVHRCSENNDEHSENTKLIDVRTCDVPTLEYLINVATKFANQDKCGFFNIA
jgi:hypothetical protein